MEATPLCTNANNLIPFIISLYFLVPSVHSFSPLLGIHPLDEKYFGSQVIKCKDGSKSFSRDRLNDNFCDCLDGTDEPGSNHGGCDFDLYAGTSACPRGKFYCRNAGSTPNFIFSSRVNDQICDCCDGSDEYDSGINCPSTCVMGGNLEIEGDNHPTGGYHWLCSDLQSIQPAAQVQKKALPLKKTAASPQCLRFHGFVPVVIARPAFA
ncbi:hypothetical protein POTOM_045716 [Populus tomentosa]|uniref:Glucosidase II beta subunit N-terminal domain-containing protein n=1 Tax=Populus tomentosa TaxID=118781 RepID=A0A8X7YKD3_POPTO|nr:hypothetical protein POTOM_045716 [Populus tomentosa]